MLRATESYQQNPGTDQLKWVTKSSGLLNFCMFFIALERPPTIVISYAEKHKIFKKLYIQCNYDMYQ